MTYTPGYEALALPLELCLSRSVSPEPYIVLGNLPKFQITESGVWQKLFPYPVSFPFQAQLTQNFSTSSGRKAPRDSARLMK